MWRAHLVLLLIAGLSGCSGCRDLRRAEALEAYTRDLVAESGAELSEGGCAMPSGVGGFCLVSGERRGILTLVDHLGLVESPLEEAPEWSTCRRLSAFGGGGQAPEAPLEAISWFKATDTRPTTVEGVHLVSMYAGSYAACLEFERRGPDPP